MFQITGLLAIFALTGASAESFTGQKTPVDNQTCISIRLPWQEAPIYFCTESENIKYKNRCNDRFARYCPTSSSPKTLQVATPWDCCALTSTPDYCADISCPAAPYNRTCTEIPADSSSRWDCCPSYFCEEGPSATCPMKRLQPGCTSAPKDKANCTAFNDRHGCCNKYQCTGEGKVGMCPMEAKAMEFKSMIENNGTRMSVAGNSSRSLNHGRFAGRSLIPHHNLLTTEMQCVGDFTCPGQMKCCSMHMGSYYEFNKEKSGNERTINGYCMEPVFNDNL